LTQGFHFEFKDPSGSMLPVLYQGSHSAHPFQEQSSNLPPTKFGRSRQEKGVHHCAIINKLLNSQLVKIKFLHKKKYFFTQPLLGKSKSGGRSRHYNLDLAASRQPCTSDFLIILAIYYIVILETLVVTT
jgi:hypothetical protein